jgi:hypothetical protein
MIVLSPTPHNPSAQAGATAPLCVCLQYVGDNGPCPVHSAKCACGRPAASGSSQCAGCRDISQFAAMLGGAK